MKYDTSGQQCKIKGLASPLFTQLEQEDGGDIYNDSVYWSIIHHTLYDVLF